MRKLIVEETKNTPHITLDPNKGSFTIAGRSFPENSKRFFEPILDWFEQFDPPANVEYVFDFQLYYISSSSIISIFEIIKKLSKLNKNGANIKILWKYEEDDEDIRKIGEDFMKLVNIPFVLEVIPVKQN